MTSAEEVLKEKEKLGANLLLPGLNIALPPTGKAPNVMILEFEDGLMDGLRV